MKESTIKEKFNYLRGTYNAKIIIGDSSLTVYVCKSRLETNNMELWSCCDKYSGVE